MSKKVEGDLPPLILLEDLGMMLPTALSKHKRRYGLYKCGFCGNIFKTSIQDVKKGDTKSCGCYSIKNRKEVNVTHSLANTKLYSIWIGIKARVLNPQHKQYNSYGGRGITICDEWKNDAEAFYNWAMLNGYEENKGLSIDRIDNDGNYEPDNCRWTTSTIQNRNQRLRKDNTSGYRGVSYHKSSRKYRVRVRLGKSISLGLYSTPEDGAVAYNNYIIENDLEGFPLNKLPDSHIHLQLPTKPHHQILE